jgi:hypothetical protein
MLLARAATTTVYLSDVLCFFVQSPEEEEPTMLLVAITVI